MRILLTLFLIMSAGVLSGCETMDKFGKSLQSIEMPKITSGKDSPNSASGLTATGGENCPQVKALPDLASITQFSDEVRMSPDKMISDTKLDGMKSVCTVSGNSVSVELELNFSGVLGPVGVKDLNGQANYTYPYFLSVISPDGKILSKDVFALSMVYENGQITYHRQDKLRQVIPLLNGQKANDFQIIVGFQLSEAELAYNRRPK